MFIYICSHRLEKNSWEAADNDCYGIGGILAQKPYANTDVASFLLVLMFIDSRLQFMVTSLHVLKYMEYITRIRILNNIV